MHLFKHFLTITKHRFLVMKYCFKAGLIKQGLTHDLSKYSPSEFFPGAKYYQGTRSPINVERKAEGYSKAWLHHKGRNKHHPEYWIDLDPTDNLYKPIPMPNKYLAESFCDHLAASKVYNKKNFVPHMVKDYFEQKELTRIPMHEQTKAKYLMLINLYLEKGEKEVFKYIKHHMRKEHKDETL